MKKYFIFDVESIGLYGEGFAVAGGIYKEDGSCLKEFAFHCFSGNAKGLAEDRQWVNYNVTVSESSMLYNTPWGIRDAFWNEWLHAKHIHSATMFVECGFPVETNFLSACINDQLISRYQEGPYPMHEIATVMLCAGMDPMKTYERLPNELPSHEPLADSRLSARLLFEAFDELELNGMKKHKSFYL